MLISMQSIHEWIGTNPSQRKYVEGERVLKAGHVLKCGKINGNQNKNVVRIKAFCLQTSHVKEKLHEINIKVKDEKIECCSCSCKAGQSEKCKHVVATLFFCYRQGDVLSELSCTDLKCLWKKDHHKVIETYKPAPLLEHECLKRKALVTLVTAEKKARLLNILNSNLPSSAVTKHIIGRHEAIVYTEKKQVTEVERKIIEYIFEMQDCDLMKRIKLLKVDLLQECCENTINEFGYDIEKICVNSKNWYNYWHKERQYRVTGSTCYRLYTYMNNKKPNWEKKCDQFFSTKDFRTEFTEYGKKNEAEARKVFVEKTGVNVFETGLVVSKLNPWLGYSPDGVVYKNEKCIALVEIKCPYIGKTVNINETVSSQTKKSGCLIQEGENINLRKKHLYYGQIQCGMAVLNLPFTYFVLYSSFDKQVFIFKVMKDVEFIFSMLSTLKINYYKHMLHQVCVRKNISNNVNEEAVENKDVAME